jgi:arylsulfatase A-like enzyme
MRALAKLAASAALVAFGIGGALALCDLATRTWVLEFQAGPPAGLGERATAFAQRAALDALGFGALAFLLGLVARGRPGARWDERSFARWLVLCAACAAWVLVGAHEADEILPFLEPPAIALLDVVGMAAIALGFAFHLACVRRMPFARRHWAVATALGSLVAAAAALWLAWSLARSQSGAWREPLTVGFALAALIGSIPVGALLGRWLVRPCDVLARRVRMPRAAWLAFLILLAACVALGAPSFRLTTEGGVPSYATLEPRNAPAEPAGPNVVLVTIDTLRADHLGCYGYARPTSPFLDQLAAEGTRFADAVAPSAWTKPSTGTILTGLYPSRHGALYHGSRLSLPDGARTLAEEFQRHGYVTAAFVANPNVKRVFEFDRGFDEYFDAPVEDMLGLAAMRASLFGRVCMALSRHQFNWNYENDCARMNRHVSAWLQANHARRSFLYLHYIDPHIPYDPPQPWRAEFLRDDHGFPLHNARKRLVGIDLYDGEIRTVDEGLRAVAAEMGRLGIWDDTLIVITSDHGEEFFEHGVLGHGFDLTQEVVHVPLVARGPLIARGRVVEEPVALRDLAATVLDWAGTGTTELGDGRSLAWATREEPATNGGTVAGAPAAAPIFLESEFGTDYADPRAFVFLGVRQGRWKLVLTQRNAWFPPEVHGAEALYDLARDPRERENLARSERGRERAAALVRVLDQHAAFLAERGLRGTQPSILPDDVRASLKALGYLGE